MPLKNKKKILIKKTKFANTYFKRFKGLMFEKKENFDYALIFEFPFESRIKTSLHMLFVFFEINVVFLNSKKEVVDKTTLKPWTINYTPKKPAKFVIEAPIKTFEKIKNKDKINW